jgi:hypothetical protein
MTLIPPALRLALRANDIARRAAARAEQPEPDPVPVLKLFNPVGAATWLATELDRDGDTLFGLADLGFGYPELGSFSLSEIGAVRLPFGLGIERELAFEGRFPLSVYAEAARRTGSIIGAEHILGFAATVVANRKSELPDPPDEGGEG